MNLMFSTKLEILNSVEQIVTLVVDKTYLKDRTHYLVERLTFNVERKLFLKSLVEFLYDNVNQNSYDFIQSARRSVPLKWWQFVSNTQKKAASHLVPAEPIRAQKQAAGKIENGSGGFVRVYFADEDYLKALEFLESLKIVDFKRVPGSH